MYTYYVRGFEMVRFVYGDIFDPELLTQHEVFLHLANCQNVMGAGIAYGVKTLMPSLYQVDQNTIKGDSSKLGTITTAIVNTPDIYILGVNLYAQLYYGRDKDQICYPSLERSLLLANDLPYTKYLMPMIGNGLANGDIERIMDIVNNTLTDKEVTVVVYQ